MASPDPAIASADGAATMLGRLQAASLRARRFLVLRGGVVLAAVAISFALATLGLDVWLRPGAPMRAGIGLMLFVLLAGFAWRLVVAPGLIRLRPLHVAAIWDRARSGSGDRLVQAVGTLTARGASGELARLARERACASIAETDLQGPLDVAGARRRALLLLLLLAVPVTACLVAPKVAGLWARRWLLGSNEPWPQDTWLAVSGLRDGQLIVAAREPFTLRVSAKEGTAIPDAVLVQWEIDGGERCAAALEHAETNAFVCEMPAVATEGTLWLRGGDDRVGPVAISPRERPEVVGFVLQASAPGSSAAVVRKFAMQDDDLRFLEGTRLVLDVEASEPVAGAMPGGADKPSFSVERSGERAFRFAWTLERPATFSIEVESAATGLGSHARSLSIGMFRDTAPRVQLECLGIGDRVTPAVRVPCRVDVLDDLGIGSVRVASQMIQDATESSPAQAITVPVELGDQAGGLHVVAEQTVEIRQLGATPGRRVRIFAAAKDRRHPEPQEGMSRTRELTIVPPEVLLAEIVARLQAARGRFRGALTEERELRDLMRGTPSVDEIATLSKRFRVAERTLWSVRRAVEDGVREMSLNRVLEDEAVSVLEKTVVEPFVELERGLAKDQREAIEAAVASGWSEVDAKAAHERQGRMISALESILRGMDRWDTLVDLIAQLGEIIRLQTEARKGTQGGGVESKRSLDGK